MQPVARAQIWIFRPKKEFAPKPWWLTVGLWMWSRTDPGIWRNTWNPSDLDVVLPQGTLQTSPTSLDRSWLQTVYSWFSASVLHLRVLPFAWENNAKLQDTATETPPGAGQLPGVAWGAWWPYTLQWFCSPSNLLWCLNFHWQLGASATGLAFTNPEDRGTTGTHTAGAQERNGTERLHQSRCFFPPATAFL